MHEQWCEALSTNLEGIEEALSVWSSSCVQCNLKVWHKFCFS